MSSNISFSFVAFLLITMLSQITFAQKAFEKGNVLVNGGIVGFDGAAPVTASVEYGLSNQIGVGVRSYFARTNNGYDILNGSVYANYHFAQLRRVDPFAGLMVEKTYYTNTFPGREGTPTPVSLDVQGGARYLFTNRFGAYMQAVVPFRRGVGLSGELGLTLKL